MKPQKTIIGRWDHADFVDLKISDVPVKIDTGAYTSSLRCSSIKEIEKGDRKLLRYTVLDSDHPLSKEERTFTTEDYSTRTVKNSGGKPKLRYSIKTTVRMFNEDREVEFTLAKRKGLRFPVLLGRKFLRKRYLVDPSKKQLSFKMKTTN